jgi:nitrogen fixation/metabolism regulation signal transduction histidine kinase
MIEPTPDRPTRARKLRKATAVGIGVIALAVGLVLLFLLTQATGSGDFYERNYERLFALNMVIAWVLALAIVWGMWRLWLRQRRGKFGSRLLIRFALIFGLASVVPGLLIYAVSYQFVAKSIENWFDVKVEGALDAGVNLGRSTLDALAGEFASQVRGVARGINDLSDATAGVELERIKDQLGATDVTLWGGNGQVIASTGTQRYQLSRERPNANLLRNARAQGVATQIEGVDELAASGQATAAVRAVAVVSGSGLSLAVDNRYLEVVQPLPQALLRNAVAVQEANREYQERALSKEGLKRMYIGTLTLAFFLAVFGALVFAAIFGKQLATPLLMLADGVRQVAAGDLRPKPMLYGMDEMGGLTRSFADMTRQLADAREAVAHSMAQLDEARGSLQTILDNITAGVVVLDEAGHIQSANPGATRILRVPLAASTHKALADLPGLTALGAAVQQQFSLLTAGRAEHALDHWQQTYTLHDNDQSMPNDAQTLVVRGAVLPDASRLLVFDDITEVVSVQRMQAWGEVARRLAHEIKNPLTPIQLSAERLEYKLGKKLEGADQAVLAKGVKTIVDQVDAMKRLVNEFRDYARLPAAQLHPLDLNALVADVVHMYDFEGPTPQRAVQLSCELDAECPAILGDAMQLRQVIHNLIQNALDACEPMPTEAAPCVTVRTHWLANVRRVRLTVLDSGPGFSDMLLKRVFEPYVTTKEKGTGLGLAVVKKIAEEHGAQIDLGNRVVDGTITGAQVSLSFNIQEPETEAVP